MLADWCVIVFLLFFLSLFIFLLVCYIDALMLEFLFSLRRSIISFIASVVDLTRFSICWVWASIRVAISSFVASACSWIAFAENCFAVSLFCLFFLAYSIEMKVIMFGRVLLAVGFCSHSRTVALNSPVAFKWYSAMSLCSFNLSWFYFERNFSLPSPLCWSKFVGFCWRSTLHLFWLWDFWCRQSWVFLLCWVSALAFVLVFCLEIPTSHVRFRWGIFFHCF